MTTRWETKKLSDLYEIGSSKRVLKSQWKTRGVPFYRGREVTQLAADGFVDNELFISEEHFAELSKEHGAPKADDIVITAIGTIGNSYVVRGSDRFYFKDASVLWMKRTADVDSDFVNLWLKSPSFFEQLDRGNGATVDTLTIQRLKSVEIRLPPLADQHRIVSIIDKAFEGIATAKVNAERNLQNARALFQRLLDDAILGALRPQDPNEKSVLDLIRQIEKARNAAIERGKAKPAKAETIETKAKDRFKLPTSWKWVQLELLTTCIADGVHKTPKYVSSGIPFITVKNLTAGPGISFDTLNYITPEDHAEFIKRTHPERGDILITKDGTIGVVRVIETGMDFSIFVSVALIKPVIQEIGPYLAYALSAWCVQSQIVPQGTALKHLYLVDLRRLSIPFPPPIEQKRIVATLDLLKAETQRLVSVYERKICALEILKKSLLHRAFSGELTGKKTKDLVEAAA
jgi:type I restriction enzyme S subunit